MLDYRVHTFLAAYRARSFTEAARELHITQPAVSQHIKHLEAEIARPLFDTRGRTIRPTATADLLYQRLSVMANDEARLMAEMAQLDAETVRPLRLGCTRTIADYVAPRLLTAYAARHPEQPISVRCDNTSELVARINAGDLDAALVEGSYDHRAFDGATLSHEPFVAVAAPSIRGFGPGCKAIKGLLACPLIVRETGSGSREILERNLAARGIAVEDFASVTEVASIPIIKELVRAGRGITFIYRVAVEEELRRGELCDITPADFGIEHPFDLIWQRGSIYEPRFRAFLTELAR